MSFLFHCFKGAFLWWNSNANKSLAEKIYKSRYSRSPPKIYVDILLDIPNLRNFICHIQGSGHFSVFIFSHSFYFNSRWHQKPRPWERVSIPWIGSPHTCPSSLQPQHFVNTDKFLAILRVCCDDTFYTFSSTRVRKKDYKAWERNVLSSKKMEKRSSRLVEMGLRRISWQLHREQRRKLQGHEEKWKANIWCELQETYTLELSTVLINF